uniref:Uncharacterized protein n=1 Tax=Sphaerodactylus townsendi TaxID=933632 RepID=A0ACB8F7Z9_9SAUR
MAGKDGAAGGSPAGKPVEGMGQVPDKDEMPRDPDLGDEMDAPVPNRHNLHLGAARRTSSEESMGSHYSWAPSRQLCGRPRRLVSLAGVVQDWPEQVKIHFFREGLHPEVAQWAMVTTEPTSLAGWYMWEGEAEVRLRTVQLLKQRGNSLPVSPRPPSPVGGHLSGSRW